MFNGASRFPVQFRNGLRYFVFEQIAHLEQHRLKRDAHHDASRVVCAHRKSLRLFSDSAELKQ